MIVALCGFMTAGKTLAGVALSEKTGRKVIDLDKYIEHKEGLDMETIFKEKGEDYFRKTEEFSLKEIVEKEDNIILSLGGGTPMNPICRQILKTKTKCFFLTCSPRVLASRMLLLQKGRPLVKNLLAEHKEATQKEKLNILKNWAVKLMEEREPLYMQCSVKKIDTTVWDVEAITDKILSFSRNFSRHGKSK